MNYFITTTHALMNIITYIDNDINYNSCPQTITHYIETHTYDYLYYEILISIIGTIIGTIIGLFICIRILFCNTS